MSLTAHVKNVSGRPFRAQTSTGRRVVRLGAQLMDDDGTLINRDHARAWLPGDLAPGRSADVRIEVTAPDKPGRYATEVRPGQRRHRLVRIVRLADHYSRTLG